MNPPFKLLRNRQAMTTIKFQGNTTISDTLLENPQGISDAQLLALFLTDRGDSTALEKAQRVLETIPLIELMRRPYTLELRKHGINKRQHCQLQAGMEIAKRSVAQKMKDTDVLSSPQAVREYLSLHMTGNHEESFGLLYLDNRHRPLAYGVLFTGTIDSSAVYPRVVLKRCLELNCAAVICLHSHPSGVAEPSDTDVRLTRKLSDVLGGCDIRLLDHLVYGQGVYTSLAERGLM